MELISYERFGKLRLGDFVPDPAAVAEATDWEWMGSMWLNEGIGFTSFSRHVSAPDETGGLEIFFEELPPEGAQRLLGAIGLPLRPGMNRDEVFAVLGEPTKEPAVSERRTYEYAVGATETYAVGCTVDDAEGLVYLTVMRADLISREE